MVLEVITQVRQDLLYALRMLGRSRGVTAVAVLALALGIGANTAIFSVVNTLLLKPLSYPDEERLVQIWGSMPAKNIPFHNVFYRDAVEWRRQSRSLETLVAAQPASMNLVAGVGETGEAERVQMWRVNAQFLPMLGARLKLGRHFQAGEDVLNAARVVVLGHGLWQRRFGGDPGVLGRIVQLDGNGYTVVGVLDPDFSMVGRSPDVFAPLAYAESGPSSTQTVTTYGKLRPGVSVQQAQAELTTIGQRLEGQTIGRTPVVWGMRDFVVREVKPGLLMLIGAVGLVLLIACANVANILLARAGAREREMAVRCAMGAVRGRLVRQLLTESCLLALAGGVAGVLLAWWGVTALPKLAPAGYPMLANVALDWRVLLATLAVSLATGVAFGLAPAVALSSGGALHEALKEGGRGGGDTIARGRLRSALVVSEVALAMLLAVGAGLLIRSFGKLSGVNPGFNTSGLLTAQVSPPQNTPAARRRTFYDDLLRKLETTPGVRACGITSVLPLTLNNTGTGMFVEGRPAPRPEDAPIIWFRNVSPGYFQAMEIPLKRGRLLTPADATGTPPVALINETAARRFWPDEDPVGKRFTNGPPRADRPATWFTVAGVVGDLRHRGLSQEPEAEVFYPNLETSAQIGATVVVRTDAAGTRFGPTLRGIVAGVDRTIAVSGIRSGEQLLRDSIAGPRFSTTLLALFAAVAVTLAAVGVYGVISYSVARRTREIGIRVALGARAGDVVAMVVGQAMALAGAGVVIGLAAAAALGRTIRTLLFGVSAFDPAIYATLAVLVTLVASLAAFVPARRAARVDPTVALRYE
jgi:putative ABC transport system permease protein